MTKIDSRFLVCVARIGRITPNVGEVRLPFHRSSYSKGLCVSWNNASENSPFEFCLSRLGFTVRTVPSLPILAPRAQLGTCVYLLKRLAQRKQCVQSGAYVLNCSQLRAQTCLRAGFTGRMVQEANEVVAILHLGRVGLGISLVP